MRWQVFHNDLPSNAWSTLIETAQQYQDDHVYTACIGRSFLQPLLPPNRVDFVFSSTALHWSDDALVFPHSADEFRAYLTADVLARYAASFETIVRHTLHSLKRGGVAHWSIPCAPYDDGAEAARNMFWLSVWFSFSDAMSVC